MKIDYPAAGQISGLRQLWQEAFGDPDAFLDSFFETAFAQSRCLCASEGDAAAAALYWFPCSCGGRELAYIYALATKKSHRGQGLARRLVEEAAELLTKQGCSGMILVPGEPGLSEMYRRMGFSGTLTVDSFTAPAGAVPANLRKVGREEYAALRRTRLPDGGVVQEGENLRFLEACAQLYAGEDFLLACVLDGKKLTAMELLGNREAAPGILAALGAGTGTFRAPGKQRPFALYRRLDSSPVPTYFGLAFD